MKNQLDRDLIEKLRESNNEEFLQNINEHVSSLIFQTIEDISSKSPLIRTDKCTLLPVNELYTGAFCQSSQFVYFLGIENPQLESNSLKKKNIWKNIWRDFRAYWRIGRKKYKKIKEPTLVTVEKYQIGNFKHDILKTSTDYLSQSSIVTEFSNCLTFVGNEDFGSNNVIKIYVCCYDFKTGVFKLPYKNKFLNIDFGERFVRLEEKFNNLGQTFVDILKIFNALYVKNYNKLPNQIVLESIICGIPEKLFVKDDIFKTFVNVANYITLINPTSFASICHPEKNIFNDKLITRTSSQVDFNKIAKMLANFKY